MTDDLSCARAIIWAALISLPVWLVVANVAVWWL